VDLEYRLEVDVSDHLGRMRFLWLAVPDAPGKDSDRSYLEANAIGLLSNYGRPPIAPPRPIGLAGGLTPPRSGSRGYGT